MAAVEGARESGRWQVAPDLSEGANLRTGLSGDPERGRRARPAPSGFTDYWETKAAISLAPSA